MRDAVQFAILGLGLAAIYSLLGSGIVLIYRGSGVVNFAQGGFALLGAITFTELRPSVGAVGALIAATLVGLLVGALVQGAIMRPLASAASIVRLIATLGVFIVIQAGAALHYGDTPRVVQPYLPDAVWTIGSITIQSDRVWLIVIGFAIAIALTIVQQRTNVGLATRAAAENELAAGTLGWSSSALAMLSWSAGGALAGLAGALIVPITGLLVAPLSLVVVPALAAALIGRFDSFMVTFAGATAIGIAQSEITRFWTQPGAVDGLPFVVIIVILVITGRSLPLRSHIGDRLPSVGRGGVRLVPVLVATAVAWFLMVGVFGTTWVDAVTVSVSFAVVLLSAVVITGYAGQVSLAQYVMAGLGAYVAGRVVDAWGFPFLLALITGIVVAVPIGIVFALPALRTRGVNLAVVSLGLAVAVYSMVFNNLSATGGNEGTQIGNPKLFGIDINAVTHPERYGVFAVVAFALAACAVANLRRSVFGRRLIAIRENERAAASLGISVARAKLYAFGVGSAIAALAGILIAFRSPSIVYTSFDPITSITATAFSVIGGLGYVLGPLFGSTLASGGIGSLLDPVLSGIDDYLVLIGGLAVILILVANPDGIVPANIEMGRKLRRLLPGSKPLAAQPRQRGRVERVLLGGGNFSESFSRALAAQADQTVQRVDQRALDVRNLSVRFGAVPAVDGVSFDVRPGEIVGLIGPNGAGKTTIIDALTGFVRAQQGEADLGGQALLRMPAARRARAGLVRSWQSLELFEEITVAENLLIASEAETRSPMQALRALVAPGRPQLTTAAAAAVREFALEDDLARRPDELPYGRRRLVGIARAVALNPSVLCLDEPAAGLGGTESAELGRLLRGLAETWGTGILLVEHDMDMVMSICDRVVVLNFGQVIAIGTPEEVRRDPAVRGAYLGPLEEIEESVAVEEGAR